MDEDLKAYLDAMQYEINDGQERLLNRLASLGQAFSNTKSLLAGDALVSGQRWLDLDERGARLERGQRNGS